MRKQIYQQKKNKYPKTTSQYPKNPSQYSQPQRQGAMFNGNTKLNPVIDLQVYEPSTSKPKSKKPYPKLPPIGPVTTNTPFYPPQMGAYFNKPFSNFPFQTYSAVPIVKHYTINARGPTDDHTQLAMIYEDVLPRKYFSNTYDTIGERLNIYNFLRSVLVNHSDGENISLGGHNDTTRNLLSRLKLLTMNQYDTNPFSNNPYNSLPYGMLIWSSCYPIQLDERTDMAKCAKNSVGVNVRIYRMSHGEYELNRNNSVDYRQYDLWREIAYYEYVREKIIKKKVCPNFVMLYSYLTWEKCGIDFEKIVQLTNAKEPTHKGDLHKLEYEKNKKVVTDVIKNVANQYSKYGSKATGVGNVQFRIDSKPDTPPPFVHRGGNPNIQIQAHTADKQKLIVSQHEHFIKNLGTSSGHALVGLTEAPNYSLLGWASLTYEYHGNVKRMIQPGFHNEIEWFSVLFQIMAAMYTMQIHHIAFHNFTIEDNVYIKDTKDGLQVTGNPKSYWKYVVNGIDYYVPNCGYLVMIDSNYKDIDNNGFSVSGKMKSKKDKYKIFGHIFIENDEENEEELEKKHSLIFNSCFDAFKNVISPNTFGPKFKNNNGIPPPESVLKILKDIQKEILSNKTKDIGYYIREFMTRFVNNRVGTLLQDEEIENVMEEDTTPIKKGDICVHKKENRKYIFVLHMGDATKPNQVRILTKTQKGGNYVPMEVSKHDLLNYSKYSDVQQNFKGGVTLTDEDLLEIYTINKTIR